MTNNNNQVAWFGQVDPVTLNSFGVKTEASYAEIDVESYLNSMAQQVVLAPLPYQMVERDITVEVPNLTLWTQLRDLIKNQNNLVSVTYLDEFMDKKLADESRLRVSFRLSYDFGPTPNQSQIDNALKSCKQLLINKGPKQLKVI